MPLGQITLTYGLDEDGDRTTALEFSVDIDKLTALGMLQLAQAHITEMLMYGDMIDTDEDDDD